MKNNKPLLEDSQELSQPVIVGSEEKETGLLALVGAQPSGVTSQPVQVDPGISSSRFSVGLVHNGGEPIPIPVGAGATHGIDLTILLESSPLLSCRQLIPVASNIPGGPCVSHNNVIAKKVLARAKKVGFSFEMSDSLEEARLKVLEDNDVDARVVRENRSSFR
jgi:hypothetical protein